jgi:hypothetical protein
MYHGENKLHTLMISRREQVTYLNVSWREQVTYLNVS